MLIGKVNLPCGCEARREIMFTQGHAGWPDLLIIGTPFLVVALLLARRYVK